MKYTSKVNNQFSFTHSEESINGLDLRKKGDHSFHILRNGKSYTVEIHALDFEKKVFSIKVNGRIYKLKLKDQFDQLVSRLGLEVSTNKKLKDVKAPMPGLVLDVTVNKGQEIKKGDKLLIPEAMKMENIIKSDGEGIIKTIHVNTGNAVDKGQLLIEME